MAKEKGSIIGLVYLVGTLVVLGTSIAGTIVFGANLITLLSLAASILVSVLFISGMFAGITKELARREQVQQLDQLAASLEQVIEEIERQEQGRSSNPPRRAPRGCLGGNRDSDDLGRGLEQIG